MSVCEQTHLVAVRNKFAKNVFFLIFSFKYKKDPVTKDMYSCVSGTTHYQSELEIVPFELLKIDFFHVPFPLAPRCSQIMFRKPILGNFVVWKLVTFSFL